MAVWTYRLALFLGIAALGLSFLHQDRGIGLFFVEVGLFVIHPVAVELADWRARLAGKTPTRRAQITYGLAVAVALLAVVPWNGRVSAPAMLKAANHSVLYAPSPARLVSVDVAEGQAVGAGTPLAHLVSPDLDYRLAQAGRRVTMLRYELDSISFEGTFRDRAKALAGEVKAAVAQQEALARERARLTLTAPAAGMVADVSPNLQPGQWIGTRDPILVVHAATGAEVEAYLGEDDLRRIAAGMDATFVPEGSGAGLHARVTAVDRTALHSLPEPELAVPFGGAVPARIVHQSLVPDVAVYRVRLAVTAATAVPVSLRGQDPYRRPCPLAAGQRPARCGGGGGSRVGRVILHRWR